MTFQLAFIGILLIFILYWLQKICYKLQFFQDFLMMYWENRIKSAKEELDALSKGKGDANNNV